ncbi:4-hydroxythreonine-4-phosphate dehydrogenase PdxA [Candidatus Laterigemmans baculatus]|uniref:4-hydroxythreonine-4-phosphate dehydrogenase PdxA n=1 Tax=Candidatus Laterigemmans baculatus TaxID=2770505 RepID=UPI0013D99403|nr:4-hydroxythreonine-4-phosphate dehydrogenase PdxA [Candidatus Laterigemmans baculatus]
MSSDKPLAITCGDPAGVGPELALRGAAWAAREGIPTVIVGSAALLARVARQLDLPLPAVVPADDLSRCNGAAIVDLPGLKAETVRPGHVNAATGRASLAYVNWAIDAALDERAAGIVTGPIHKEAWHAAGSQHPGHTELLAERTGAERHCMMLAAPSIRCALVTVHIGLADVPSQITTANVLETIEIAAEAVGRMIDRPPRVSVCGLNPHAGEGGLFGRGEEEAAIIPAIEAAVVQGIHALGPLPPDTAFLSARRAETDVYVCMYHDQGLIPLKAIAFDEAVNVTLGLPIVRTSVDHGTALDLAWQGKASDASMLAAIRMAAQLA